MASPMRCGVLMVLAASAACGAAGEQQDVRELARGRVLVVVAPGVPIEAARAALERPGLDDRVLAMTPVFTPAPEDVALAARLGLDRSFVLHLGAAARAEGVDAVDAAAQLRAVAADVFVSALPEGVAFAQGTVPNDSDFAAQWSLRNTGQPVNGVPGTVGADIDAPAAWTITTGSRSTLIAVLDTGVTAIAPELFGKVVRGYNWSTSNPADWRDYNGHGTYCAGIAAANSNNGAVIAGVAWGARILPCKVLADGGGGLWSWIASGIVFAADQGAKVASISLGATEDPGPVVRQAVQYAAARGMLVICAAGNGFGEGVMYPAAYPEVLAVSSTDHRDLRPSFTSVGEEIDIAAPGVDVLGASIHGLTERGSGTSVSTPIVAGVAALVLARNPRLSAEGVRAILLETADDVGPPGVDRYFGAGRVNAHRAVLATTPGCSGVADWNLDGAADVLDLFAFLDDYSRVAARADLSGNGVVGPSDFFWFLDALSTGCP